MTRESRYERILGWMVRKPGVVWGLILAFLGVMFLISGYIFNSAF